MNYGVGFMIPLVLIALFLFSANYAFAASISWDFIEYFPSDGSVGGVPNTITVDDNSANLDPTKKDTIQITITSTSDAVGIPLTLTETDVNTGIFQNTGIIWSENGVSIPLGRTATISILDSAGNSDPAAIDILPVFLVSSSDMTGINVNFAETAVNSNLFSGKITFGTGPSSDANHFLHVSAGDEVSVVDTFLGLSTNTLITPNNDPGFGIIKAKALDTISAHYDGLPPADTFIGDDTGCGGCGAGGGGVILISNHPLIVIDALLPIGGSPYIVSPPSFGGRYYHFSDGLTLTQGKNTTTFDTSQYNQEIPKQVMIAGTPVNMTFKTFESYNPTGIVHMGLYLIPRGQDMITDNSIGSIVWDKGQPLEVNDQNHILSDVKVSPTDDGKFQHTTFSFTPTKSFDKMSFLVRAWNDHLYSTDIRVHDDIVAPQAAKTLPAGVIQYNNFADLEAALEKDQFIKPQLLSHIHGTSDVFPNSEGGSVYWLYDTIQHTVTLVIADKDDNILSSKSATLQPYAVEKKGDYNFMYFTVEQLNRWNEGHLKNAMELEAEKAMSFALEKKIILHSNW